jgi:hypothetical protein
MLRHPQDLRWIYQPGLCCQKFISNMCQWAGIGDTQYHLLFCTSTLWEQMLLASRPTLASTQADPEKGSGPVCQLLNSCGLRGLPVLICSLSLQRPLGLVGFLAVHFLPKTQAGGSHTHPQPLNTHHQMWDNSKKHSPYWAHRCFPSLGKHL